MAGERICAGIVTYNPDIDRLRENLDAVCAQVNKVFVVDNHSENIGMVEALISQREYEITLIKNDDNYGIARALNQLIDASKQDFEWVLTLDQDSVIQDGLLDQYKQYLDAPKVGMICCDIKDRNYSLKQEEKQQDYEYVTKCITSGTLTNIKACLACGGFDNDLFIDMVDDDICYSMAEKDYKILKANYVGLLHEIGKSTYHKAGDFEFVVNNHSALRKYYISRNSVYMIRKHRLNPVKEYFYIYRRILTVTFFEEDKMNKIKAIIRGIRDGRKMEVKRTDEHRANQESY